MKYENFSEVTSIFPAGLIWGNLSLHRTHQVSRCKSLGPLVWVIFGVLLNVVPCQPQCVEAEERISPSASPAVPWYDADRRRVMLAPLTASWVQGAMKDFDAERWADQLHAAGAQVIIFGAKQSYGDAYYPSKFARYMGCDVLGPLTEALHDRGMRIMVYINLNDKYILEQHPDWRAKDGPGTDPVEFNREFKDYVLNIVEEIVSSYPVDGIWFDLWATGVDLMKEVMERVKPYRSDLAISFNGSGIGGDELTGMVSYLSTEGHDVATCSRHAKALRRWGKPFELQVPENLGGWLTWKPRPGVSHTVLAALAAANGGTACPGALVHPHGWLDQGFLDELSKTWHWLEKREPWFVGMHPWSEVGVIMSSEALSKWYHPPIGLHSAFSCNHVPYDIIRPEADFLPYRVLILTNDMKLNEGQAARVREFVRKGGSLLSLYGSYVGIEDILGIQVEGTIPSEHQACYIGVGDDKDIWKKDVCTTPLLIPGASSAYLVRPNKGCQVLAPLILPFAPPQKPDIYPSYNAPGAKATEFAAIVRNRFGAGEAIYVSASLAGSIESIESGKKYSAAFHKRLLTNLVDLLGGVDQIWTDAPAQVEINLGQKGDHYLVHLTDCSAGDGDRYGPSEADLPVLQMKVSLPTRRLGAARRVRVVPEGKNVPVKEAAGRLEFDARVRLHSIYEIY